MSDEDEQSLVVAASANVRTLHPGSGARQVLSNSWRYAKQQDINSTAVVSQEAPHKQLGKSLAQTVCGAVEHISIGGSDPQRRQWVIFHWQICLSGASVGNLPLSALILRGANG